MEIDCIKRTQQLVPSSPGLFLTHPPPQAPPTDCTWGVTEQSAVSDFNPVPSMRLINNRGQPMEMGALPGEENRDSSKVLFSLKHKEKVLAKNEKPCDVGQPASPL